MRIDKATKRAREVSGAIGSTAVQVGGTVGSKAKDLGGTVGSKAKDLGGTIGTTAQKVRKTAGPTARALRSTARDRTKEGRKRVGYWIAGEEPPKRRAGLAFLGAGVGAAAAFFLDPKSGKRRRAIARDWIAARARTAGRRTARGLGSRADGLRQRIVSLGESDGGSLNDPTLEQKVQSEVFLGLDLSSKQISIMVTNGVVSLRGTVDRPELITQIEERVRSVDGVRDVENQLHAAGTPAPTTP
jgi:gas vesicle protein